ncbi:MKL/myocardin-like protein 2 [Acromyrmex echinatior]|uniref:MKL/myocardin-like protein 2 n=1 Tax=Acromyrmex echinatior TaxID=103372 RepID=F4WGF2_ACREC|nr:MKL/myocardin-like protein 2 [Acromyrmex echinatior]
MLKKARLADQLNDQLSHRPGPLELIQKNILHTEEPIERAVKEGHIPFKATCEGQVTKPQHPDHYITFEDDSQSSEGAPSPQLESRSSDVLETAAASAGIVTVSLSIPSTGGAVVVSSTSPVFQQTTTESTIQTFAELCNTVVGTQQQQGQQQVPHGQQHTSTQASQTTNGPSTTLLPLAPAPSPMSLGSTTSSLSPLSNISIASPPAPPPAAITPRPQPSPIAATAVPTCQRSDAPGKDKNRKKSKTKSQPKTRTIKFHEYKLKLLGTAKLFGHKLEPKDFTGNASLSRELVSSISDETRAWANGGPHFGVAASVRGKKNETGKKDNMRARKGGRVEGGGQGKNEYGAWTVNLGSRGPPQRAAKRRREPQSLGVWRNLGGRSYRGPPNAQKAPVSSNTSGLGGAQPGETSYELLLQQQQLFLQWQLEWQHKYPQIILPAAQKPLSLTSSGASDAGSVSGSSANAASPAPSNSSNNPSEQPPLRPLGKLEDMKVSDLKVELKRRNLPVSGSKPQLIERLKPFTESSSNSISNSTGPHVTHMGHILMDTPGPMATDDSSSQVKSPSSIVKDEPSSPRTASPHSSEHDDPLSPPGDDIIKVQRKRIEELQRELYKSQQQLQQIRQTQPTTVRAEKLALQQHIQNKMQQQQLALHLQQLQHLQQQQQLQHQQQQQQSQQQTQPQQATIHQINAKASLAAFLQAQPNNATAILDSATLTAINNKKNQSKNSTTVQIPTAIVLNLAKPTKLNGSLLGALVAQAQVQQQQQQQTTTTEDIKPPPPQYDEAAKLLKVKIEPVQKSHIKSQVVDDVLEILIKNGELPPSAAQDPATPTTPNRQLQPNLVFTAPADNPTQSLVFTAASPMSPISPIPMEVSQSGCPSPSTPAPPPPPPLPLTAFSIQLPTALQQLQQQEEITAFGTDLLTSEAELDATMLLSPQSVQQASPDPQPPQEVTPDNANLDLKELGLDLETLDPMDFVQLDCDMPMDMDDPDWLDSLMPQSPPPSATMPSSNHQSNTPSISLSSTDIYDPLLGSSQYSFDLFNMEDSDFKMSSDLSPMTWDKVDFAT